MLEFASSHRLRSLLFASFIVVLSTQGALAIQCTLSGTNPDNKECKATACAATKAACETALSSGSCAACLASVAIDCNNLGNCCTPGFGPGCEFFCAATCEPQGSKTGGTCGKVVKTRVVVAGEVIGEVPQSALRYCGRVTCKPTIKRCYEVRC